MLKIKVEHYDQLYVLINRLTTITYLQKQVHADIDLMLTVNEEITTVHREALCYLLDTQTAVVTDVWDLLNNKDFCVSDKYTEDNESSDC